MAALAKPLDQRFSPLNTELLAIKEVILFSVQADFDGGEIEIDSQMVV